MKITALTRTEYKGCPIYIMQFGTAFQYLFIFRNELYQHHGFVHPVLLLRILWWLRLREYPYTPTQIAEGKEIMLSGAIKSIDAMLKPGARKIMRKQRGRKRSFKECVWQIRETKQGNQHYCLEHYKYVPISDEKPKHE